MKKLQFLIILPGDRDFDYLIVNEVLILANYFSGTGD